MADIQLTADNSQVLASLKNIENSVKKVQSSFSTFANKASSDLASVTKSTDSLATSMSGLKKVLGLLGIGTALTSLADYGRTINNVERATGIATGTIKGFADAVNAAGGNGTAAAEDLIDLQNAIHDARTGGDGAAKSFAQIGVSLSDLYKGNSTEIFDKVKKGLQGIPDPATRSAVAVQLLGRQFKDIDVKSVLDDMDKFNGKGFADRSAEATGVAKQVGEIGRTFSKIGKILTEEFLLAFKDAIDGINKLSKALLEDRESIIKFVDTLKWLLDWAVTIGSFFLGGFLVKGVTKLITVFSEASVVVSDLAIKLGATGGVFSKFFKTIQSGASTTAVFFENVLLKISNKAAGASEKVSEIIASRSAGTRESIKSLIDDARQLQQRIVELGTTKAGNMKKRISEADRNQIISLGKELEQTKGEIGHLFKTRFDDTTKILGTSFSKLQGVLTGLSVVAVNFWDNLARIWTGTAKAGQELSSFESSLHSIIQPLKDIVSWFWNGWAKIADWIRDIPILGGVLSVLVAPIHAASWAFQDLFGHAGEGGKIINVLAESLEDLMFIVGKVPILGIPFQALGEKAKEAREAVNGVRESQLELQRLQNKAKGAEDNRKQEEKRKADEAARQAALKQQALEASKLQREITAITDSYRLGNIEQETALKNQYDMFRMTEEEKAIANAILEIDKKRNQQLEALRQKQLEWSQGTEQQKAGVGMIKKAMEEVSKEAETTKAFIVDQLKQNQAQERSYMLQKKNIDAINAALQEQASITRPLREKIKDTIYEGQTAALGGYQKSVSDLNRELSKAIDDLENKFSETMFNLDTNATDAQMMDLYNQHNEAIRLTRQEFQERKKNIDQSRDWATGWKKAFNEYIESSTNSAELAKKAFDVGINTLSGAFEQMITRSEGGWVRLRESFKATLAKMVADWLAAQAMMAVKNMMGGGTTAGGAGSSLMGSAVGGISKWVTSLLGFAEGGQPPLGKASIVGENGPELFMPKSAGTILPNGVMPQAQAPAQQPVINNTYVTNNISALDAKSVAQLFAENRKTLFGAVTQAKREQPGRFAAV